MDYTLRSDAIAVAEVLIHGTGSLPMTIASMATVFLFSG
jgi:hypothetical protein